MIISSLNNPYLQCDAQRQLCALRVSAVSSFISEWIATSPNVRSDLSMGSIDPEPRDDGIVVRGALGRREVGVDVDHLDLGAVGEGGTHDDVIQGL